MKVISIKKYCKRVSLAYAQNGRDDITPEQIMEAVGGIANLYFEQYLKIDCLRYGFKAHNTFATKHIKTNAIVKEIQNCTGISVKRSKLLFKVMQSVFGNYFKHDKNVWFKPLGKFRLVGFCKYIVVYKGSTTDLNLIK